ncbi:MAG: rhomboid family intramembrane serine protease [Gemmatimonadales bacterium]|nr:rhomboid family intramembrane serine protease [Gemmatimonadales bacterium]NIN10457.1 rhomboid family intramembrane serine protease [Gemmatimonadales bacterium]NIN49249.1 rhomboid family intramembrane serine protease [Gemmatimonadales bacterium]NIP06713.1 rhomboid family intramembrane serine protease [Gemmatimonadales bacterium]NIR00044.1 rhomboid family intramembrane serine protease [Gemmatimonadales bacterium]
MRTHSPFSLTPWVRGLIVANAVVYLLTITVFTGPWFYELFAFNPARAGTQLWGFVSYMFVHGGFLHLAFNMLMLFFFGPAVEDRMGATAFGLYYFICGLGGAAFSFAVGLFTPVMPFVGASAAVFGVSLAFAMHWPDAPIYVFPLPVPIKAKWLVVFLATINLASAILGSDDGVAHLAHLGGFLFGFIYLVSEGAVARRAGEALRRPRPESAIPKARRREAQNAEPPVATPPQEPSIYDEVDRVLDKISATGLDSLTPDERRLLDDVSRQLREH